MNSRSIHPGGCCALAGVAVALSVCCSLELALASIETNASSLTEEALLGIKFDQKVGDQVSLDLTFRDDAGKGVQLGDYFNREPVILVLGYYECPMLCSLVLNG